MSYVHHIEIRLVRYSRLIDQAIAERRYSLATHLGYRCLLEYQRLASRFLVPGYGYGAKNAYQLAIVFVEYMRKSSGQLSWTRTRALLNLLTSSYQLTRWSVRPFGDRDMHFDLAMATYARDQSLALSKFLIGEVRDGADGPAPPE